jgi:hypothetical protein
MDKRIYNKAEYYDETDKLREPERDSTIWDENKEEKQAVEPMTTIESENNTTPGAPQNETEGTGVTDMAVEGQ